MPIAESFKDEDGNLFFINAIEKIKDLAKRYATLAEEKKCHFLDITAIVQPSPIDGMHLDAKGHEQMAAALAEKIRFIYR